jgi:DNA processing protein
VAFSPGVGWKTIYYLLNEGLDKEGFDMTPGQWRIHFPQLSEKQALALSETLQQDKLRSFKQELERKQISYVTMVDSHYPPMLKEVNQPPWVLFLRGDHSLLNWPSLAVVGTRNPSSYGKMVTKTLVPKLVKRGLAIVSGMALGIDTLAHEAALEAQGSTVAVLGGGIDVIYPRQNRRLYERLIHEGLVVSEYPPQTSPHPGFFPQRNRIIAGLSYGVVVVEAAHKSGSLITAHLALENGREVFAVPGSVFNEKSVGTNRLIQQQGGKLVISEQDIWEELAPLLPNLPDQRQPTLEQNDTDQKENYILELMKGEKVHINELHLQSGWPLSELSRILIKLEMKNKIVALPGSFYQRLKIPH